ncbi:hypothetical protein DFQ30_004196, partial [Apophysomyces sp. BC1015]
GSLLYVLGTLTFRAGAGAHTAAFFGALVSYGVVIYKKHGVPQLNSAFAQRLVMDENVQYLLLAIYWFFSPPLLVTLVPYATFSWFHALGYIRTQLLPTVAPVAAGSTDNWQKKAQTVIAKWIDETNYKSAMRMVAQTEVVGIMGRLILGLFKLRIMPIFVFAQFLRFRYYMSNHTREAFSELRANLDRLLLPPTGHPSIPPMVTKAYVTLKEMIIRYGEVVTQQAPETQQNQ